MIRKVTLTGSIPVGRLIAERAGRHLKPVSMELGGHAPVLILDDVDPVQAASVAAAGKFRNGGQVCIAASRFLVPEATEGEFADAFVSHARSLRLGDGRSAGTDMGPLESARRVDATAALVEDAISHGATLVHGGRRPPELRNGFFFEPTVLRGANGGMSLMRDEPFGPIAPIMAYDSLDHAIAEANATSYGLAGFVFTQNLRRAFEISEALEVGMVGVNNLTPATAEAPFGGVKDSGFGREGGTEGVEGYTTAKYINMAL